MQPVLFYIGPYPIWSYGFFMVVGMLTLYVVGLGLARRDGKRWDQLLPLAAGMLVGGIFGARLSHLLVEPDRFAQLIDFYSLFQPSTPGNIVGLIAGGYVGVLIARRLYDLPSIGNYFAAALAAASVMWRVGCVLSGSCHGRQIDPTTLDPADLTLYLPPLYDGLFNLALFFLLWRWLKKVIQDNLLIYIYFSAYAFFRFWLEFVAEYPRVAFGLTGVQLLCLTILIWQALWWGRWWRMRQRSPLPYRGVVR